MREVVTVELEHSDVVAAIEDMLKEKGYAVGKVDFKLTRLSTGDMKFEGASVIIIK